MLEALPPPLLHIQIKYSYLHVPQALSSESYKTHMACPPVISSLCPFQPTGNLPVISHCPQCPSAQLGHQYSSCWHWSVLGIHPERAWGRGGQRNCLRDTEFLQKTNVPSMWTNVETCGVLSSDLIIFAEPHR